MFRTGSFWMLVRVFCTTMQEPYRRFLREFDDTGSSTAIGSDFSPVQLRHGNCPSPARTRS